MSRKVWLLSFAEPAYVLNLWCFTRGGPFSIAKSGSSTKSKTSTAKDRKSPDNVPSGDMWAKAVAWKHVFEISGSLHQPQTLSGDFWYFAADCPISSPALPLAPRLRAAPRIGAREGPTSSPVPG